jgi:hypothetical protein
MAESTTATRRMTFRWSAILGVYGHFYSVTDD